MKTNKHTNQQPTLPAAMAKVLIVSALLLFTFSTAMAQGGLKAEYYDGKDFDRYVSTAYVGNIDNEWYDTPLVPGIDPHNCSIRWTGKLRTGKTGTYLFSAIVDDGIRVWIDGDIIINQWHLNDYGTYNGSVDMRAGQEYDIKVEYFNALREGEIKLQWAMEKSKDDQSWYERVFGVEYQYQVIHSDYFVRSEEPEPEVAVADTSPPKQPTPQPKRTTKPTKTKLKQSQPQATPQPAPTPTMAVTTVAAAEKYLPKNVEFVRTKAEILPTSFDELNTFAQFMADNPTVTVTIEGHTDCVGVPSQNQFLSERRANRVARYLVEKGIAGSRLKTVGYGGTKPLKVPAEGEYYPPNRRVVFVLQGLE